MVSTMSKLLVCTAPPDSHSILAGNFHFEKFKV